MNTRWTPYAGDDGDVVSTTPRAEFSIIGETDMVCAHQVALCKMHNCATCDHHGDEASCPFAYNESLDDSTATFTQALEIYSGANVSRDHKNGVLGNIRADLARVGLSPDSRCSEMTRTKFKTLIAILTAPMADGRKLRGETVASHLAAFRSISSEALEDRYNDRGLELPTFSIPKYHPEKVPVQEVSDRTIRKVEIQMERWLASGRPSDRNAYIFTFFALYCGMRAGDICAAKWDIIRHTTAGILVAYTPRKTMHSAGGGVVVSFPIDNRTYCRIEPLIGAPEDYIIPRLEDRAPGHVMKHGEYAGRHMSLRAKVNRALAECGIGNDYRGQKKTHALRKYFETDQVFASGRQQAAAKCGHTLEIQKRNYLGTMIGKVA